MYRGLADTELLRGGTDRCPIVNHVHSQIAGSFFNASPHVTKPPKLCIAVQVYARGQAQYARLRRAEKGDII